MWVLSRLHVQIQKYPLWRDRIQVETWATSRLGGVRAYRDFRLLDANDEPVGAATSLWLLLDVNTRRPVRIPDRLLDLRVYERESVLPDVTERLERQQRVDLEKKFDVVVSQSEHFEKETRHVFKHRLVCEADDRELALAKTVWSSALESRHYFPVVQVGTQSKSHCRSSELRGQV